MPRRLLCFIAAATLSTICLSVIALAQSPPERRRFELVSLRPNRSGSGALGPTGPQPGGRWVMLNGSARVLISRAFSSEQIHQIVGLPSWAEDDRLDLMAVAPSPDATADDMREMVRTLLAERFRLKAHFEEREEAIYSLVRVSEERLGPQIRPVDIDCDGLAAAVTAGRMTPDDVPKAESGVPVCTSTSRVVDGRGGWYMTWQHSGTRMRDFASRIRGMAGRYVVDRTDLDGFYEYTLEFSRGSDSTDAPAFVTALSEQLGLRLASERGPVPYLLVDAIERPTFD